MNAGTGMCGERVLTADQFDWLRGFLRERTGIELRDGKELLVMSRLDQRLRRYGLTGYGEYLQRLAGGDADETRIAIDLITTNETSFFREPAHFELLGDVLRATPRRDEPVRVWSAACSTGEEAHTIAMTCAEHLPPGQPWQVLGSDISTRVLETARRGLYPVEASGQIPPELLRRYCLRGRDEYAGYLAIDRELRERIEFRHLNLVDLPDGLGPFDVVFLRNVMIYFSAETKRALVGRIVRTLRPGGYLITGHSESLTGIPVGLRTVRPSVYRTGDGDG